MAASREMVYKLLLALVADGQRWCHAMMAETKASNTLNRRSSSPSSFYRDLGCSAAELRLPVNVPDPSHAQFIALESSDPVGGDAGAHCHPRELMGLPWRRRRA